MVQLHINRSTADCYAAFCDTAAMRLWLPALKHLRVAQVDAQGRIREAVFELGESLSYALVYAYDDQLHRVRWVPSAGVLDAVSGLATFEPDADGTRFVYALESLRGREPDHERHVAEAFVEWMHGR
jgi:hypothetical protein